MRKLIVGRHAYSVAGAGNPNAGLTRDGREQARRLGINLRGHITASDGPVLMLASASNRGREAADIVREVLELENPPTYEDMLWKDSFHRGGTFDQLVVMIRKHLVRAGDTEVLIIIGHHGHGDQLASYLASALFNIRVEEEKEIDYGEACVVDIPSRQMSFV